MMRSPVKILPNYTYEDYTRWEGRWEIIEGIPFALTLEAQHQRITSVLLYVFNIELKKYKHHIVYPFIDYLVKDGIVLQPDMLVVCKEITKKYLDFPPVLVAEILSPATALKDRHTKFGLYEAQQIPYYLIIAPEEETVEVYQYENGAYQLQQTGHDFQHNFLLEDCSITIDFTEIWQ
jgi:Uma2 family endonuclease